jgi:hypothetical protein
MGSFGNSLYDIATKDIVDDLAYLYHVSEGKVVGGLWGSSWEHSLRRGAWVRILDNLDVLSGVIQ